MEGCERSSKRGPGGELPRPDRHGDPPELNPTVMGAHHTLQGLLPRVALKTALF